MNENAFNDGHEAGMDGATDAENPYRIGTDEAMSWEDGRAAGEAARLERRPG